MKRLAAVVGLALAGFAAAMLTFNEAPPDACLADAPPDTSYSAEFAESVTVGDSDHVLRLSHDGEPVTAERVCLDAEMVGMSGTAVTADAEPLGPGRYEVVADFPRAGPWQGSVLVDEEGAGEAAVPVSFEVRP